MAWGDHHGRRRPRCSRRPARAGCAGRADTGAEYGRVVAITVTGRFRLGYEAGGVSPCQGSSCRPDRYRATTAPYARQNGADNRGELKEEMWIWTM
jgi:hypothetical protein